LATGGVDFSNALFSLNGQHYGKLAADHKASIPSLDVGLFINAIIQCLIVSFAIFQDAVAAPTKSEVLLAEIRDLLKAPSQATPSGTSRPE